MMTISQAFALFMKDAPDHATAWMQAAKALDAASVLDKKTEELAYVAVLAATRNVSGIPFGSSGFSVGRGRVSRSGSRSRS
jgi:alkylhydroperoxidase/carboxymuconolactone decarboxylase family protein YurZ